MQGGMVWGKVKKLEKQSSAMLSKSKAPLRLTALVVGVPLVGDERTEVRQFFESAYRQLSPLEYVLHK